MAYQPGHHKLDYVEIASHDLDTVRTFFSELFGWTFTNYGNEYTAFDDGRLNGGFYLVPSEQVLKPGAALIGFYSEDLAATQQKIEQLGAKIVQPIFSFPGGRRFHFNGPDDLEYAVWSDK